MAHLSGFNEFNLEDDTGQLVIDILQPYRTGNYSSLMDFEPILEKELVERLGFNENIKN